MHYWEVFYHRRCIASNTLQAFRSISGKRLTKIFLLLILLFLVIRVSNFSNYLVNQPLLNVQNHKLNIPKQNFEMQILEKQDFDLYVHK